MNFILLFLNLINKNLKHGYWGYWGLGIGDWALAAT